MSVLLVVIMETEAVARAIANSLDVTLGDETEIISMTYRQSQMSRDLLLKADLFVLDVFSTDRLGFRAEGLFVAEKFASAGRRVLLFSGLARSDRIDSDYYWDVAAKDTLTERVLKLLRRASPTAEALTPLSKEFSSYYRKPYDGGHH